MNNTEGNNYNNQVGEVNENNPWVEGYIQNESTEYSDNSFVYINNAAQKPKSNDDTVVVVSVVVGFIIIILLIVLFLFLAGKGKEDLTETTDLQYIETVVVESEIYGTEDTHHYITDAATETTTSVPATIAEKTTSQSDAYTPYFPTVSGFEDNDGYIVAKGKSYIGEDGNMYYLPDILVEGYYSNLVEEELANLVESRYLSAEGVLYFPISYKVYCVEDIISLYVIFSGPDGADFRIYNINSETGEEITDAMLLRTLGISEDEFYKRTILLQQQQVDQNLRKFNYGTFENPDIPEFGKSCYEETTSKSHFMDAELYVDSRGYLHIVNNLPFCEVFTLLCDIVYT